MTISAHTAAKDTKLKCEGPYEEDRPDEIDCDNCGKTFLAYVHYTVTYSAKCLPDDHDFEIRAYKDGLVADCRKCNEMQFSKHPTLCSPAALKALFGMEG